MQTNKELPEGWERVYWPHTPEAYKRSDGACVFLSNWAGWTHFGPDQQSPFQHDIDDPFAAIAVLDREYPLGEQEHGEK